MLEAHIDEWKRREANYDQQIDQLAAQLERCSLISPHQSILLSALCLSVYSLISGIQDLKIYSHADSLILSPRTASLSPHRFRISTSS